METQRSAVHPVSLSMGEEQFVTVTAYETEQLKIISLPDHYTPDEICEAIRSEMASTSTTDAFSMEPLILDLDLSSIIITSGKVSSIPFHSTVS